MGGLGFPELLVIGVIALLIFGPKRLPDAGKALGQAIGGFQGAFEAKEERPAMAQATPGPQRTCPACSQAVEPQAAFCPHCGRALTSPPYDKPA
jgi:sec-independent protein translocase protein TatA